MALFQCKMACGPDFSENVEDCEQKCTTVSYDALVVLRADIDPNYKNCQKLTNQSRAWLWRHTFEECIEMPNSFFFLLFLFNTPPFSTVSETHLNALIKRMTLHPY